MREDRFQVYSETYNTDLGNEWWRSWLTSDKKTHTKLIPLENIRNIPVAMFVGEEDLLADPKDSSWTRDQIGEAVVHYEQIPGGHLSFLVGKDMSYFTHSVMGLLERHHPTFHMSHAMTPLEEMIN